MYIHLDPYAPCGAHMTSTRRRTYIHLHPCLPRWRRLENCKMSWRVSRWAFVISCFLEVLCQFSVLVFCFEVGALRFGKRCQNCPPKSLKMKPGRRFPKCIKSHSKGGLVAFGGASGALVGFRTAKIINNLWKRRPDERWKVSNFIKHL